MGGGGAGLGTGISLGILDIIRCGSGGQMEKGRGGGISALKPIRGGFLLGDDLISGGGLGGYGGGQMY